MTSNKSLPSQELLRHLFDFDPLSGFLICKNSPKNGARKAGEIIGTKANNGYLQVKINKTLYLVHRIIWMWQYGEDPNDFEIDHIDHNKSNNKLSNLRLVTRQRNQWNLPAHKTNSTGVVGVIKRGNSYQASLYMGPEIKRLVKSFATLQEAIDWRKQMVETHRFIASSK